MSQVRIIEVGPRDGLQNEATPIPTELKLRFIDALRQSGLPEIEATSFVSPKWVPQLADAAELWPQLPPGPLYSALVPNQKGLESALKVGTPRIALFTAASQAFTTANINRTIGDSLADFREIIPAFRQSVTNGWIRGYVSTAFECPFQGLIHPDQVVSVVRALFEMGVDEVSLGDTVGRAGPLEVCALSAGLLDAFGTEVQGEIAWHFHDTYGTAIANVQAALNLGYRAFDASAGGLGGCPYAPGAGGNLATEDLVYLLERQGIRTGIDLMALSQASLEILAHLGREPSAKAQRATLAKL